MPFSFPALHKATKVFDESLSGIPVDVTVQGSYPQLVALITHFRNALYQDRVLREPYLHVLTSFYESDAGALHQLKTIRPHPPTDDDVLRFVQDYWPDTHLVSLTYKGTSHNDENNDEDDDEDDGVRNEHSCNNPAPHSEARIQIVAPIVDLWLSVSHLAFSDT